MYYRRRVLVALIEAFGGELSRVDCQKLMLLFCQRSTKPPYSFFPHTMGGFSLVVEDDQRWLVASGLLAEGKKVRLVGKESLLSQLHKDDISIMDDLVRDVDELRGEGLQRKTYIEYPWYAVRSRKAKKLLTEQELLAVKQSRNTQREPTLFTLGYEGISIDKYLAVLIDKNIDLLIDVRNNPLSRKYGFSKKALMNATQRVGIHYVHFPELGIPSNQRRHVQEDGELERLFRSYAEQILPAQPLALLLLRTEVEKAKRSALMCFEGDNTRCHRRRLADYLVASESFNQSVVHL